MTNAVRLPYRPISKLSATHNIAISWNNPTLLQYAPHYRPSTLSHVLAMAKSTKYTRNLRVITKLDQSANPCCALLYASHASHAYCNNHTTTQLRTQLATTPPDLFTIEQHSQPSATSSTISLIQHSPTLFKR